MEKKAAYFGHIDGTERAAPAKGRQQKSHLNLKGFKWLCCGAAIQI